MSILKRLAELLGFHPESSGPLLSTEDARTPSGVIPHVQSRRPSAALAETGVSRSFLKTCDSCNRKVDIAAGEGTLNNRNTYLRCRTCWQNIMRIQKESGRDGDEYSLSESWDEAVARTRRHYGLAQTQQRADVPGQAPEAVVFGKGTKILQFPEGTEQRYENHLELIKELKNRQVYPQLRVIGMRATRSGARWARIIVVTGTLDQARQVVDVYNKPEADAVVGEQFNGNWGAINPQSNVGNVPDPGCSITTLRPLQELVADIQQGKYDVDWEID